MPAKKRDVLPLSDVFPLSEPRLQEFLAALSWKYVTDQPTFGKYQCFDLLDREQQQLRLFDFAGRVWFHKHGMLIGNELTKFKLDSLAGELREYESQNGRTIPEGVGLTFTECWASFQLARQEKTYMFIQKPYEPMLEDVVTRIGVSSDQLVWLVGAISKQYDAEGRRLSLIVSDGQKSHTIHVAGLGGLDFRHPRGQRVDGGWFTFHDTWPARSLLAPERGYGCVEVLEDVLLPPHWLISPQDLNRVIVGFCVTQSELNQMHMVFTTFNEMTVRHLEKLKQGRKAPFWFEGFVGNQTFPFMLRSMRSLGGTRLTTLRSQRLEGLCGSLKS